MDINILLLSDWVVNYLYIYLVVTLVVEYGCYLVHRISKVGYWIFLVLSIYSRSQVLSELAPYFNFYR